MNFEERKIKKTVREGYQLLLGAEARLLLPVEKREICRYYEALAEKCMQWAVEIHGTLLQKEFLALETAMEKARFQTERYRFSMRCVMETEEHIVLLCESRLLCRQGKGKDGYHRISHVWNLDEETVLPFSQILNVFGGRIKKQVLPFSPDGIYPEGDELIFFKNPTADAPFSEFRIPLTGECLQEGKKRYNN